jgi:ubiquilin
MGGGGEGEGSEPAAPAGAAALATLHIRGTSGNKFAVQADLGATVGAFKAIVAGSCDVPAPQQRLIYKGRILKDDQTLASYGACASFPHLVQASASVRFGLIFAWMMMRLVS